MQILKQGLDLVAFMSSTWPKVAEAQDAFYLYMASLGKLYLTLGMPAWVRLCLGGGLLTALKSIKLPLKKHGATPDARPVRAEDVDTGSWCKALPWLGLLLRLFVMPLDFSN